MAGYIKPTVLVIQEIRSASPPLLLPDQPAVIVGPAYNTFEDLPLGTYPNPEGYQLNIPGGAKVVEGTLKVVIKQLPVVYLESTDVTVQGGVDYLQSDVFAPNPPQKGDVVVITKDGVQVLKTQVRAFDAENNKVFLTDLIPDGDYSSGTTVQLARYQDFEVPQAAVNYDPDYAKITLDESQFGVTVLPEGSVYVSYKLLRSDKANQLIQINSLDDIELNYGPISPDNPLAYALSKALANTTVAVYGMAIEEDNADGYGAAFNELKAHRVYFIVPLSQEPAVIGLLPSYLAELSKPEVAKFRVALVNPEIPFEEVLYEGTGDIQNGVLTDKTAAFFDVIGDGQEYSFYIRLGDKDYKVDYTINNNQIKLVAPYPPNQTGVSYQIVLKYETKVDVKEGYIKYVTGIRSNRIVAVFPPKVEDDEGNVVPGYHLAAALAGALSGLPPHKPVTFMAIGGFNRVLYTDHTYFDEADMNDLAEAGYLIVTQDDVNSPPYVRHQITTDPSSDYTRELSAVRTIDALSDIFRKALMPYIGRYNITDDTLKLIEQTVITTAEMLKKLESPFIGPMLLDYKLGQITQLSATSVDVPLEVKIPMPLNYIFLHVIV
jgi:hypothetical protein